MSFDWYKLSLDMSCRFLNLIWVVAWYELSPWFSCNLSMKKVKGQRSKVRHLSWTLTYDLYLLDYWPDTSRWSRLVSAYFDPLSADWPQPLPSDLWGHLALDPVFSSHLHTSPTLLWPVSVPRSSLDSVASSEDHWQFNLLRNISVLSQMFHIVFRF